MVENAARPWKKYFYQNCIDLNNNNNYGRRNNNRKFELHYKYKYRSTANYEIMKPRRILRNIKSNVLFLFFFKLPIKSFYAF